MFNGRCSHVRFKYEWISLFCFYCGRLGHNDSFCEAKMLLRVEIAELAWDLSLCAQSRRVLSMNSIWLREEDDGKREGDRRNNRVSRDRIWDEVNNGKSGKAIDPILGFNLEEWSSSLDRQKENILSDLTQTTIERDLEDGVLIGKEGKKRDRGAMENLSTREETDSSIARNRRLVEFNHLSSTAAKRQASWSQWKFWAGMSMVWGGYGRFDGFDICWRRIISISSSLWRQSLVIDRWNGCAKNAVLCMVLKLIQKVVDVAYVWHGDWMFRSYFDLF